MCVKKLFPDTNIVYFLIIPQRIFFSCECLMDEYLGFKYDFELLKILEQI